MGRNRRDSRPGELPRRTPLACVRCRGRRTRCSGERPRCKACEDGSHQCVYLERERCVPVPESELEDLRRRASAFDRMTAENTSETSPSRISPGDLNREPEEQYSDNSEELIDENSSVYIGPHGFEDRTTTGTVLRVLLERLQLGHEYRWHVEHVSQDLTYNPEALPKRRPRISSMPKLPPLDVALSFYAAQYRYIGTIFAFIQPHVFEARLRWAHEQDLDLSVRDDCLAYCQVLLILAFGQLYSVNRWDSHDGPPGFQFFAQALQFLPDLHEEGSLVGVEVLCLTGYFLQNLNRRDAAFLYVGLALRMAISLGLHQEIENPALSNEDREHRRRIWWSVYSMDRILCAKSGHPITILDDDIGVAAPSRLLTEAEYSPATVLYHYTELSKILGQMLNCVYRKRPTGSALKSSVRSILRSLEQWHRNVPQMLRPSSNSSRESVSTFLHYYQCINMTARPLLFHVVQRRLADVPENRLTDWRAGKDPDTVRVIELCISAARDSTAMLHAAAKQDLVATYGYMDNEHAFSAALILIMVNIAFPFNEKDHAAMEMALDVLDSMARRGNTHMRAKLQVLRNLRLSVSAGNFIDPDIEFMPDMIQVPTLSSPPAFDHGLLAPSVIDDTCHETVGIDNPGDLDDWEASYGQFPVDVANQDWASWTDAASNPNYAPPL